MFWRKYRIIETSRKGRKTYTIQHKVGFWWVNTKFNVLVVKIRDNKPYYSVDKVVFHPFTEGLADKIVDNLLIPLRYNYKGFEINLIPSTVSNGLKYVTKLNNNWVHSSSLNRIKSVIDEEIHNTEEFTTVVKVYENRFWI